MNKRSALRRFNCRIVLVFAMMAAPMAQARTVTEAETMAQITKDNGAVIPAGGLPATYKYVADIGERLANAQANIQFGQGRSYVSSSQLFILDNANPSAFVVPMQVHGVHGQRNLIFVTRGLLNMLQDCADTLSRQLPGTRSTQIWAVQLANILAHEFAHPKIHQDDSLWRPELRAFWHAESSLR